MARLAEGDDLRRSACKRIGSLSLKDVLTTIGTPVSLWKAENQLVIARI